MSKITYGATFVSGSGETRTVDGFSTKAAIGDKRSGETLAQWFCDEVSDIPWKELADLELPPLHAVDEVGCKREGRKARCFANPNQTVVIT